jgi:hypothetical protein
MERVNLHVGGGEADEVGTETEAGTLTGGKTDRGGEEVKDGEDDSSNDRNNEDLLVVRGLAGDDHHGDSNGETLEEILDGTSQEFSSRKTVHLSLYSGIRKKVGESMSGFTYPQRV